MTPVTAFIGLGSNLGNRPAILQQTLLLLSETPGIQVAAVSGFHETDPVNLLEPDAPRFLNAAARLETTLSPEELLTACQQLETRMGRERGETPPEGYYSRTLDLDILFYGDQTLDLPHPQLQVPHPRLSDRMFVLAPLVEIAPDWQHPQTGRTVQELKDTLAASKTPQPV